MWAYWTALGAATVAGGIVFYTDWRWREIPNWLTGGLFLFGLALWTAKGLVVEPSHPWLYLGHSFLGGVVGLLVFGLFYFLGAVEMGDVKYMAAVGALVGWPSVVFALIYTAICGAAEALVITWHDGTLGRTLRNLWRMLVSWVVPGQRRVTSDQIETSTLPYGIAIALGSVWTLLALRFETLRLFW